MIKYAYTCSFVPCGEHTKALKTLSLVSALEIWEIMRSLGGSCSKIKNTIQKIQGVLQNEKIDQDN